MQFMQTIMKKIYLFLFFFGGLLSTIQSYAQTDASSNYEWKKVTIGGGGYVSGIVFSEARRNVIYSRTDVGGAYRRDSITNSWIQLLDFVGRFDADLRCVESIATDPTDENRVYIASGGSTGSSIGGIYWSTDQGKTLNYVNTPFKMAGNSDGRGKGERLIVDPNSPNVLFYRSRVHGLYKSIDYAKTWTKVTTFPNEATTTTDNVGLCYIIFDKKGSTAGYPTNVIYVGVSRNGNSLYKSIDAGVTWSVVPGTPANLQPHNADIDTSGMMYLTYCDTPGPWGISSGSVWRYNT